MVAPVINIFLTANIGGRAETLSLPLIVGNCSIERDSIAEFRRNVVVCKHHFIWIHVLPHLRLKVQERQDLANWKGCRSSARDGVRLECALLNACDSSIQSGLCPPSVNIAGKVRQATSAEDAYGFDQ